MPANRPAVERAAKEETLLGAAESLFLARGFAGTTVAAVARQAGVTATTVYWYFPSKDALFVAVLERWVGEAVAVVDRLTARGMPPERIAHAAAGVLADLGPLIGDLHDRAAKSAPVRELHRALHDRLARALAASLVSSGMGMPAALTRTRAFVLLAEAIQSHTAPGTGVTEEAVQGLLRGFRGAGVDLVAQ